MDFSGEFVEACMAVDKGDPWTAMKIRDRLRAQCGTSSDHAAMVDNTINAMAALRMVVAAGAAKTEAEAKLAEAQGLQDDAEGNVDAVLAEAEYVGTVERVKEQYGQVTVIRALAVHYLHRGEEIGYLPAREHDALALYLQALNFPIEMRRRAARIRKLPPKSAVEPSLDTRESPKAAGAGNGQNRAARRGGGSAKGRGRPRRRGRGG